MPYSYTASVTLSWAMGTDMPVSGWLEYQSVDTEDGRVNSKPEDNQDVAEANP